MTDTPIKLYVGCSPNGEDAESLLVLEHSIKKNTTVPVDITWMKLTHDPKEPWYSEPRTGQGWNTQHWATPFSGFRWAIPWVEQDSPKAIYCDSDFIFLSDLNELWQQEFEPGKVVMAKGGADSWRYCLAMWNVEVARKELLPFARMQMQEFAHHRMMNKFSQSRQLVQPFQGNWNCIDGEDCQIEDIDALHYSDMGTQFHLKYATKRLAESGHTHWFDGETRPHWRTDLQDLFDGYYNEALDSGMKVSDYVPDETSRYGRIVKESQAAYRNAHKWAK